MHYMLRSWVDFPYYTPIHYRKENFCSVSIQYGFCLGIFITFFTSYLWFRTISHIHESRDAHVLLNNLYKVDKTNTTHISLRFLHIGRKTERISIDDFCTLILVFCYNLTTYNYLQAASEAGLLEKGSNTHVHVCAGDRSTAWNNLNFFVFRTFFLFYSLPLFLKYKPKSTLCLLFVQIKWRFTIFNIAWSYLCSVGKIYFRVS